MTEIEIGTGTGKIEIEEMIGTGTGKTEETQTAIGEIKTIRRGESLLRIRIRIRNEMVLKAAITKGNITNMW